VKRWVEALKRLVDARREPRRAVAQHVTLTIAGQDNRVPLLDISPSGAMVGFDRPVETGETVIIHVLDREPLRGQVRWSRDGHVGIGFDAVAASALGGKTTNND
jgi:hypothetical protein